MRTTLTLLRQDPARAGLLRAGLSSLAVGVLLRVPPELIEALHKASAGD